MKRSSIYRFLIVLCLAALMAGCGPSGALLPAGAQVAQSALPRVANPQVAPADQAQLAAGNRAFAMDLYQHLRTQDGNLVFSPYSISLALAMTYAGARGETAQQMASVLRFDLPPERLHPAFNALDQSLTALAVPGKGILPFLPGKSKLQLNVANSLWAQQGFTFLPAFLDLEAQNYGAGVRLVDYTEHTEAARQAINGWVSDRTQAKIPELFKPNILNMGTRLVLADAVYFKADWEKAFDPSQTKPGAFHLLDGSTVSVPMMASENITRSFASGDDYQAVGLVYANPQLELIILLPDTEKFASFEAGLDAKRLGAILGQMQPSKLDRLELPRFKSQTSFDLSDSLKGMGMTNAFAAADFSGMDGRHDLKIKTVVHQAYLAVDEQGTEAAAATGVVIEEIGKPPSIVQVDRPFIYLVYDQKSGTILFIGRVLNPLS